MTSRRTDVAILGAGTAGLTARRAAKAAGASVLLIDGGPFGTTCARVGCMPSKLLITAADAAHHARHAERFGVHAGDVRVDGPAVMARVQRERDRFVGFVVDTVEEARRDGELIEARAKVTGPGVLTTSTGETIAFRALVLATGSIPTIPPPYRELGDALLTNESLFELPDLPGSVLVVGAGVIGLELGQALHRLGVRTTILGVDGAIGPLTDPEVLAAASATLGAELDLHTHHQLERVAPVEAGVEVAFVGADGVRRTGVFERVLVAAGRRPALADLGLEHLGVPLDARGLPIVDPATLQAGNAPVFVAGDANGLHPVLHEAADDGRVAGDNAARHPVVHAPRRSVELGIVFTDPQIAVVGGGHAALAPCDAVAGDVRFDDQGRARVLGQNVGIARVYAERRSGRLLGAEIVGPRAEHLGHLVAWAVEAGLTAERALEMPFYHPVVEEGLRTALRRLQVALRRGEPIKCRVDELGVGS